MRKVQTAALTAASLLVFCGYYSLGDALDLLPGPVTVAYADVAPRPFPTVSYTHLTLPTIYSV